MPADHELPKRRSGKPTDDDHETVDDLFRKMQERISSLDRRFSDHAASDADQLAADSDQTLSDSDQTLADADQQAAEDDQARSKVDQGAADRDQAAADRDHDLHRGADPEFEKGYEASSRERASSAVERSAVAERRAVTMYERIKNADRRDVHAFQRDADAAVRDRTAELRDQATDQHERLLGRDTGYGTEARLTAKADRQRAAEDRARAAEDRKQAAVDRELARAALEKAELDELTGFYRLGLGKAVLQAEIDRSRREDGRLVFAYCDVDNLKLVNDGKGHAAGDALLKGFAEAMRLRLRSYDPVVRVGGDEFVCSLSHMEIEQAEGALSDVQQVFYRLSDGSMSFGLAALKENDSLEALMERSDQALREAKAAA